MTRSCLFYVLASVAAALSVQNIGSQNISSFKDAYTLSLIAFIAPWCESCQELEPVFEAAAGLKNSQPGGQSWGFARVDCVQEKEMCARYKIPIYPTLLLFQQDGKQAVYNGPREPWLITAFMHRYRRPTVTVISNTADLEALRAQDNVTVVGHFTSDDKSSTEAFAEVAERYREIFTFASTSQDWYEPPEPIKRPSVVVYKTFDAGQETYDGPMRASSIEDFLGLAATPLIKELGAYLYPISPANVSDLPVAYLFADSIEDRLQLLTSLLPLATRTRGEMRWAIVDPYKYPQKVSELALKPDQWPGFAIQHRRDGFKFAYPHQGSMAEVNIPAIEETVRRYLSSDLVHTRKSQAIPDAQDGPVKTVVADTFEDTVFASQKDTLMLYYSPACKHCIALEPVYQSLGELLRPHLNEITIAKIDAINNDVSPPVSSFPTIKLFKAEASYETSTYKGDRTLENLLRYLQTKSSKRVRNRLVDLSTSGPIEHGEL